MTAVNPVDDNNTRRNNLFYRKPRLMTLPKVSPQEVDALPPTIPPDYFFIPGRYVLFEVVDEMLGTLRQVIRVWGRDKHGDFYGATPGYANYYLPQARVRAAHAMTREEVAESLGIDLETYQEDE